VGAAFSRSDGEDLRRRRLSRGLRRGGGTRLASRSTAGSPARRGTRSRISCPWGASMPRPVWCSSTRPS
jgi:hypothetical protein